MPGSKDGAAVLVGQCGGFERSNGTGSFHDLGLVHADQRTEHRNPAHGIGAGNRLHGLARHLSHALAGNQGEAVVLFRNLLGNFHHQTAHDNGEVLLRTVFLDRLLYFRKRHTEKGDVPAIGRDLLTELLHFFQRTI